MDEINNIELIEAALEEIRPHLAVDGGNVELVDFKENIVYIKWLGNCNGCSMSAMTLKAGIEHTLKNKIPEIKSVVAVN
ncbi:MAG: NifU family protein [Saprospiraceae bacterium]|jgi:Fe-S cluster biogenesis protein NfuA|nr:NifU family protein [Saprospiraceae bacterium]